MTEINLIKSQMKDTKNQEDLFALGNKADMLNQSYMEQKTKLIEQKRALNRIKSARETAQRAASFCWDRSEFLMFAKWQDMANASNKILSLCDKETLDKNNLTKDIPVEIEVLDKPPPPVIIFRKTAFQ